MQYVQYQGYNTGRGLSPNIWGNCPVEKFSRPNSEGVFAFDDFLTVPVTANNCVIDESDVGGTAMATPTTAAETDVVGMLRMTQDATDNDEQWIQIPTSIPLRIDSVGSSQESMWFEARVRLSSVVDDVAAIAVGLSAVVAAGDDVVQVDDTGVMANISFLGFRSVHVNGGTTGTNAVLGEVYRLAGQTAAVVRATAQTMVAATWYKLGLRFNITDHTVGYYVDGVLMDTVASSTVDAATFPNDTVLNPLFAIKSGTGTASTFDVDWYAVARTW
jgi:hypothetical protein